MKKAQVTLFIIIAILIIAIIFLIFWQQWAFGGKLSATDLAKVKSYVDDCFKLKTRQGVLLIAKQGGYNTLPDASINFLEEKTAYYFKDNQTLVPTISTVEEELNSWLNDNLKECLSMPGYSLTTKECNASSKIKEKVRVDFNCPIVVTKDTTSSRIPETFVEIEAPITKMLDVSAKIIEEYKKNRGYVCVSCFDEIALANNVTIKGVSITKEIAEPEHIWFLITDKNIKFDDKNITWRFVIEI
ncbi:MAG: hypothetical protein N3G19_03195 [Candidatus Pacearchaeota archaeon]|nr:hypothetical protein [Candidatus Pacearchaeota archaeon]